jgi:hypothetical protein
MIHTLRRIRKSAEPSRALAAGSSIQLLPQLGHRLPLPCDFLFRLLLVGEQVRNQVAAQLPFELLQEPGGILDLLVDRQAVAEAEFGVVFKQRVRPGGPLAVGVLAVRRARQVAAVDRRAARGV